ncbi:sucrase ferredoxin [Cellulomonas sp.]|uniref:sucrase ferredoxin n=1 Tax=Cellulomonas sp. TaxID=40001 RepID=UPI001B10AD53|nr:sucrase ferredoxin [Cellulomonas sp.]MBO9555678.1 sucrase ferredoxin [Cellulomonas sp.]
MTTGASARPPGWRPCSDLSLARGDPLRGTAGRGERWLLVEVDGGWGKHAFLDSTLDADLADRLVRRVERAGVRTLAIRRTGLRADVRRAQRTWSWALVDARPGHEEVRWGSVDDPAELLDLPLDGSAGVPSADPVLCVCTHARHDQCCAVRGRPVVEALAAAHPDLTWECSHLGGDRFAATMVVFPEALLFGRVEPADATRLVERYRAGRVDVPTFRGRASLTNVEQAAHAFARDLTEDDRIDAFSTVSHSEHPGGWTVVLDHGTERLVVELGAELSEPMLSTCGATHTVRVREFVLRSLGTPAAR